MGLDPITGATDGDLRVFEARQLEHAKFENSARLEEYKALRAEIVTTLSAAYLTTNLTLSGVAALLAASPFIIQYRATHLFLLASFMFYFIAWTQLRYALAVFNMSQHIARVTAPGIRRINNQLTAVGAYTMPNDVMSWETSGRSANHPANPWYLPMEFARYAIPLAIGLASAMAFLANHFPTTSMSLGGWLLFVLDLCTFLYSVVITVKVRRRLGGSD